MKSIDEARQLILGFKNQKTERLAVGQAVGRILAEDIISSVNIPPFDKSAMDGYACDFAQLSKPLQCVGLAQAGIKYNSAIESQHCVKIMTGAPIPVGANGVFMYEDAEVREDGSILCRNLSSKKNICYTGEDIAVGARVMSRDTFLKPHHLGILASIGVETVLVYQHFSVGIVATGTELRELGQSLNDAQIINSSSPLLCSKLAAAKYYGIVPDNKDELKAKIEAMQTEHQVLIITGGASDSDFDLVPLAMRELSFDISVRKVAMQPGKPFLFAHKHNSTFCFGLSGNPVSAFVQFLLFVEPFLGVSDIHEMQLPLASAFSRKKSERDLFAPVRLTTNGIEPIAYNGSAHIAAFADAWGIMKIEAGTAQLNKGDLVYVRQL